MKHVQYWGATSIWRQSTKIEPPWLPGAGVLYTPALLHIEHSTRRRNSGLHYGKLSPLDNFCLICLRKTDQVEEVVLLARHRNSVKHFFPHLFALNTQSNHFINDISNGISRIFPSLHMACPA